MMQHRTPKTHPHDDAISPVIGTILMVAATVIIAGAVYSAVNAYNGRSAKSAPDAAFKAQALDTDENGLEDMIKITYLSGPASISANVSVNATSGAALAGAPAGKVSWSAGEYQTFDGGDGAYFVSVRVGETVVLEQTVRLRE